MGIYLFSTVSYILLCKLWLIPAFPLSILVIYGFVYTPLISYVSARLEGVVGQQVAIPMVREGVFILSGYRGVDVWFAPIPLFMWGGEAAAFKQLELTRTDFGSLIKIHSSSCRCALMKAAVRSKPVIWCPLAAASISTILLAM